MPANFILSEIMLKSYIGYEIMLYENKLFTAHLQVLLPYTTSVLSRNRPRASRPRPSRPSVDCLCYVPCALGIHDFPDVYNAIPWISLRWVAGASARLSRPPRG